MGERLRGEKRNKRKKGKKKERERHREKERKRERERKREKERKRERERRIDVRTEFTASFFLSFPMLKPTMIWPRACGCSRSWPS
jgi:hypothetical protein